MTNIAIAPFSKGEIILQNYNQLFSLTNMYEYSDRIFLYFNEFLLQQSKLSFLNTKMDDFEKINKLISYEVLPLLEMRNKYID